MFLGFAYPFEACLQEALLALGPYARGIAQLAVGCHPPTSDATAIAYPSPTYRAMATMQVANGAYRPIVHLPTVLVMAPPFHQTHVANEANEPTTTFYATRMHMTARACLPCRYYPA
eukprot:GHVU01217455.1.p2 GENE.GHVU01217455.1~~GHVU01217455.1.p2  ORF type:complete len:117 (+),score=2.78 GHVU01217455.1:414-764(+)